MWNVSVEEVLGDERWLSLDAASGTVHNATWCAPDAASVLDWVPIFAGDAVEGGYCRCPSCRW